MYINPVLVLIIEILGLVAFSISGALAAFKRDLDIIGYIIVGTVTGIGGGTVRDLILDRPVFWLYDSYCYSLNICILTSVLTFIASKHIDKRENIVNWFDALGLALFAVQGYIISMDVYYNSEIAVIMGVITGCGGGLLRDICMNRQPFIFRGEIYASAAIFGLIIFAFSNNVLLAFASIFILRALAIKYKISLKN